MKCLTPLKKDILRVSFYLTVNTLQLNYKDQWLMLFAEIINICCENHTEYITYCVDRRQSCGNFKAAGTHSNHCALKC